MALLSVGRCAALRYRVRAQQLHRETADRSLTDADVLDLGVQDTGTGGALWALANRGVAVIEDAWPQDDLVLVWSVRGAPHAYRRRDLPAVATALRPLSPADAAKRLLSAATPLAHAGIPADTALATVAAHLRTIVTAPMVKATASGRLSAAMGEPYVHFCRSCDAVHVYEMPFRLGALAAGLELEPGTSPPVLRPVPGWPLDPETARAAVPVEPRLDPVRAYLHHLGPARPADVAGYLDAPVTDVATRWPADAVEVEVDGTRRWVLEGDVEALRAAAAATAGAEARTVRLLGPFDLFLQGRDRDLLVPDRAHRTALWPALGRPGAVLVDGELVGAWRPRATGRTLRVQLDPWAPWDAGVADAVRVQAERLAAYRGARLTSVG